MRTATGRRRSTAEGFLDSDGHEGEIERTTGTVENNRGDWRKQHHVKAGARDDVARGSRCSAEGAQRQGAGGADEYALPDEVEQRPAD